MPEMLRRNFALVDLLLNSLVAVKNAFPCHVVLPGLVFIDLSRGLLKVC